MPDIISSFGQVKSVHTLVDFYQYIKSVEYLICLAFFVSFPAFYSYLNKDNHEKTDH